MNWNERYNKEFYRYSAFRADQCQLCGASDDGTHTIVSNGKCKDTEDCETTQQWLKDNPQPAPEKKKRRTPYVDRSGMAPCQGEECLTNGTRHNALAMHWVDQPREESYCSDHIMSAPPRTIGYREWQSHYKRKK